MGNRSAHFALALVAVTAPPIHAATIRVPADQPTIQAGINAASSGDTVMVSSGEYSGPGNGDINFGGVSIVLRSETGPQLTVVDVVGPNSRGFLFNQGEDSLCILDGFTIKGGTHWEGAGLACQSQSSPTIRNCVFSDNVAGYRGSPPTLGGGIACINASAPFFVHCRFEGNAASYGGAISCRNANPRFDSCVILNNEAFGTGGPSSTGPGLGGAVYVSQSAPEFRFCTFQGNYAQPGLFSSEPGGQGGAVYATASQPTFVNCTFDDNRVGYSPFPGYGAALYSSSSQPTLIRCLLTYNSGEGIVYCAGTSAPTLECTDLYGVWSACIASQLGMNGNVSLDPMYCDRPSGNLFVSENSPCAADQSGCGLVIGAWSECVATGIRWDESGETLPDALELHPNMPNPFNAGTIIRFSLDHPSQVVVTVYNVLGNRLATIQDGFLPAGSHNLLWDGREASGAEAPTGVYFYQVNSESTSATRSMLLLR